MLLLSGVAVSVAADATPAIVAANSRRNMVVASPLAILFNVFSLSTDCHSLNIKFAVMEDSVASGHIAEFEYCKNNRVILALLRQKGKGSTWMIGDAPFIGLVVLVR
jgi:hypothetical protein